MKILINTIKLQNRFIIKRDSRLIHNLKKSSFFSKKSNENSFNSQINSNQFEDISNPFKLPTSNFLDFYKQLKLNVDEISNNPSKLDLLIKEKGREKVLTEVENLNKLIKEGKSGNETFRYMEFNDFLKHKANTDGKMKFMMPLFWGWAFPIIKYCSIALLSAKVFTGIPWYNYKSFRMPFFIVSGLVIRLLMLPLMIRQMILIQRMSKISPNIKLLTYCVMRTELPLVKKYWYYIRAIFKYSRDVKVNLLSFAAYNLFQIPVFFTMVMSIRKIASEEDLTNTGMLWFKNLNEADPYMILPVISVLLTYINLGRGITKDNEHWFINRWRSFFQVIQILYLPFTCQWPAGSHLYWITSTSFIFIQNTITKHPYILSKINPTYFIDMQRVFESERNIEDSNRYIQKIKNVEDTRIKLPTSKKTVLYDLKYEKSRISLYQKNLKYKRKIKNKKNWIKGLLGNGMTLLKRKIGVKNNPQ